MKISFKLSGFLIFAAAFCSLASARAANAPFHFDVGPNDQLVIHPAGSPNGPAIAQLIPGDIGKRVSAPPYVYLVSYGHDADGNLSIIVTPEPENPTDLTLDVKGHVVEMDKNSAVTITITQNGNVVVDPGVVGVVHVDGNVVAALPPRPQSNPNTGNENTPNYAGGQTGGNNGNGSPTPQLPVNSTVTDIQNPLGNPNVPPTPGTGVAYTQPDVRTNPQALTPVGQGS